jgi:hypothetical protein
VGKAQHKPSKAQREVNAGSENNMPWHFAVQDRFGSWHQSSDSCPCIVPALVRGLLIAISNNKADQEYLRLGTGIESVHLPSLCMYTKTTLDVEEAKQHKVSLTLQ